MSVGEIGMGDPSAVPELAGDLRTRLMNRLYDGTPAVRLLRGGDPGNVLVAIGGRVNDHALGQYQAHAAFGPAAVVVRDLRCGAVIAIGEAARHGGHDRAVSGLEMRRGKRRQEGGHQAPGRYWSKWGWVR